MTAAETIAACRETGVALMVEGGGLRFRPTPDPAVLESLKKHKAEIVVILGSKTPEGDFIDFDAIDALRALHAVPLPDDFQSRPGLRPLSAHEKRQVRTGGAPLPAGVSYGQTQSGQWRRLT